MKIEINDKVTKNKFYKAIVEQEKKDFLEIIKKLQVKKVNKYSVYTIAAKIARGETVSSEELKFIRENAPALLEDARRQNEERVKTEKGKNSKLKEVKPTNSSNQVVNDSEKDNGDATKTEGDSGKVDNNSSVPALINRINIG